MSLANSHLPPIPPSPARSFASTSLLSPSLQAPPPAPLPKHFLSRADVSASISAYENLFEAAKAYREALSVVASAASVFGSALEACARCKGAGDTADGLMNAGGLQYLIASNMHILSQSLHRGFEAALLHDLDSYKEKNQENEERYRKEAGEKSRELRKKEQQHLKLTRQKTRNLSTFRSALVDLTEQIDTLESLKYAHFRTAYDLSQETATHVLDSSALVVRAEIEVFEKIAQKGWDSSGGLDDLIARAADPFAPNYGIGAGDGEIFSILPTHSILPSPQINLSRVGSASRLEGKFQSLSKVIGGGYDSYDEEDSQSIFSAAISSPKSRVIVPDAASDAGWGNDDGDPKHDRSDRENSDVAQLHLSGTVHDSDGSGTSALDPGGDDGDTETITDWCPS